MQRRWKIFWAIAGSLCGVYWLVFEVSYLVFVKPHVDLHHANMQLAAEQHEKDLSIPNRWARELCSNCGTRDVGSRWNGVKGVVSSPDAPSEEVDWLALGLTEKDAGIIEAAKDNWPTLIGTGTVKFLRPALISDFRTGDYWELPAADEQQLLPREILSNTLTTMAKGRILGAAASELGLQEALSDVRGLAMLAASTQSRIGTALAIEFLSFERIARERHDLPFPAPQNGKVITSEEEDRLKRMAEFTHYAMHSLTETTIRVNALRSDTDFAYCGSLIEEAGKMGAFGYLAATTYEKQYQEIDRLIATSTTCRLSRVREIWKAQGTMGDQEFADAFAILRMVPMFISTVAKAVMATGTCNKTCLDRMKPPQPAH